MKFTINGYTSSHPDFTDIIELPDGFDFEATQRGGGDPRYTVQDARKILKAALLDSACDTDYLNVFDESSFEVRPDLAERPGQIVLLAESYGCDNCQDPNGDGSGDGGDNEYTDGCDDDAPHGGFMITLDPIE